MFAPGAGISRPQRRHKPVSLPPAHDSAFRYLLEAHDNLALFTVIDPGRGLLKLIFSPHQKEQVREALAAMRPLVTFEVGDWPL